MATPAGTWTYDDAQVMIGATTANEDISGFCAQAMVHFEHIEVPTPHTFGQSGQVTSVSDHYSVTVTLDLITDNFSAGQLDRIFRALMKAPLGSSDNGEAAISISPSSTSPGTATNPTFSGKIVISQWDPFGGGQVGDIIRQTRTFTGTGDWDVDDS